MTRYKEPEFRSIEDMVVAAAEMVRPIERLSVSQAASKYRYLDNPGSYTGYWPNEKTPYLVEPMDVLTSLDFTGMVFVGPARTGKGLPLDTPIPTPRGWRTMGDLRIGDELFGRDGKPCLVEWVSPDHFRDCFKITFDDGSEIVTDDVHRWEVDDVISENTKVLETNVIAKEWIRRGRKRFAVRNCSVVQYATAQQFLDPYILGIWLGDGSTQYGHITVGARDMEETKREIEKRGWQVRVYQPNGSKSAYTFGLRSDDGVPLIQHLATMGLGGEHGKFVPPEYIFADEHQRRELIRGLMDTDGSLYGQNGRAVQFGNANKSLSDAAAQILLSLGYKVRTRSHPVIAKGKRYSDAHKVEFTTYDPAGVFSMPRKIAAASRGDEANARISNTTRRFIANVERVPSVVTRCIAVSASDKLYLAGPNFIPTHNTDMFFNWLTHTAICDPADMMRVDMTREVARDWSIGDFAKMLRNSKEVAKRLIPGRQNDNVHDKRFKSGMRVLVKWPTITELSGKTLPRVWFADYDRMEDDIAKEGPPFDLGRKRTQTFKRFGMTVAESSPGREVTDPKWMPKTPHEAPPTKGILALYNRGDRRRWYWRCLQCRSPFEPDFGLMNYPDSTDFMEAAEMATMKCPHCGFDHEQHMKPELQEHIRNARWVKDGMLWMPDGSMQGKPIRTDIASFWMKGPAAAFQDWTSLVFSYLQAKQAFDDTGDEGPLKKTVTADQGLPYISKLTQSNRLPEELAERVEDWGGTKDKPVVPASVRFLVATVDVQAGAKPSFVVQVHGIGEGGDISLVDMFKIKKSNRLDEDGERHLLDPAAYQEDWEVLVDQVIERTYPLNDYSGRHMAIKKVGCDSGGAAGVTANAYKFWRWLRDTHPSQHHKRFQLVKGNAHKNAPRTYLSFPDAQKKDNMAAARGDVPVLLIHTDMLKDMASNMLGRTDPGAGMIHFPHWSESWLWTQLTAELRTAKGWENPRKKRNEAFDLLCYCIALCLQNDINFERLNWQSPPRWAAEWDSNLLVFEPEVQTAPFAEVRRPSMSLEELAAALT